MIPGGRDIKIFTGTMDQDTEGRYLGPANYRYLLNARSSITTQGGFGAIEDVMGNELVPNSALPPGQNKVIGSYEDIADQSCIYFVWNSSGFHGIYRWFSNRVGFPNGVIETIYKVANPAAYTQFNPNPLNFQQDKLVTGVNLVDNLLFWTDNYNDPKYINIDKANETNKIREYNFYINQLDLSVLTTYTINVSLNGVVVDTILISSNQTTLESRIEDLYNQLLVLFNPLTSYFRVFNKNTYILFENLYIGNYYISVTTNTPNPASVLPENFYPDFTVPGEYPPIPGYFFNQIKNPPFCAVSTQYVSANNNIFQGVFNNISTSYNGNTTRVVYLIGYGSDVNDPNNNIVLGPTPSVINVPPTFNTPPIGGYVTGLNGTYTFNLSGILSITNGQSAAYSFSFYWQLYTTPTITPGAPGSTLLFSYSSTSINTISINRSFTITSVNPADQYVIILVVNSGNNPAQQITYNFSGAISGTIGTYQYDVSSIARNSYLFRSKYVYDNNENSIYSAISKLALPSNLVANSAIEIDYNDLWLDNFTYLSEIKKLILAYSDDNGTTWYDFQTILPYDFTNVNLRKYTFTDNDGGTPVPTSVSLLQYSAIGNKVKSQEFIDDRIFHGGITEGYDAAQVNYNYTVKYYTPPSPSATPFTSYTGWKYGYTGEIGIVYYDDYDRKCAVCINNNKNVNIPYYNNTLNVQNVATASIPYVELSINNDPPDWATKYQVVRTKDTFTGNYLIWQPRFVSFYDVDLNATSFSNAYYAGIDVSNIAFYNDNAYIGNRISYTFVDGDRIRVISGYTGNTYNQIFDAEILLALSDIVYIKFDPTNPICQQGNPFGNTGQQCVVELYTPSKNYDNNIFYEIGECYEILTVNIAGQLKKYHSGNVSNQNLTLNTPAVISVYEGGVYYRNRNFPIATAPPPTPINQTNVFFISSQTPNESVIEKIDATGRTNITGLPGVQFNYTSIRFSDKYFNKEVNELNTFQSLNTRFYSASYGLIHKMQVVNNDVLKLIFGNSYQLSIYVNQSVLRQTQNVGNLISLSDDVAGNSHLIQRTLGTINAESVIVNDEADMFGYDENEGVVWVASGNGLIQISDRGMKSTFVQYAQQRRALGFTSETPAVYDLYHDEYILTLGDMPGFTGVTIAYNKQKGGWTSYYSFVPEYYGRVRDYVVSFKDGNLWVHDRNTDSKNFYGVQYNRQLTYISNKDFPKVKDYKAISVNGIGANSCPTIRILPFQGYLAGMLSSLSARFFQTLEGVQYAYFQKDKLSPGFGGNQLQALINGRNLKGQVIEVTLENTDTAKSIIYSSDIVYFYSEHS